MSASASFHTDQAARQLLEECQNLASTELATHKNTTVLVDTVDLENALGEVDTDRSKLGQGWLLSSGRQHPPYDPARRREQEPSTPSIEMAFWKLKALTRAKAERTVEALWQAVGTLIPLFQPAESVNYFKSAGYDAD